MGLATIVNMGAISRKFSQRMNWTRWNNLTLNDATGFFDLETKPDIGGSFYGTINQVAGQNLDPGVAGARSSWQIDIYTDAFFGWEPENAYTLVDLLPIHTPFMVPDDPDQPINGYVHHFRVINARRWDNGQLWVYRCQWMRSGIYVAQEVAPKRTPIPQ